MALRLARVAAVAAVLALSLRAHAQDLPVDHYILALSWQPAFCQYRPDLPECPSENPEAKSNAPETGLLTLHGLWPNGPENEQLSYCAIDPATRAIDSRQRWCQIPELTMSEETRAALDTAMPGSLSCLDRHEWLKHGSCSALSAEEYFSIAVRLTKSVAQSPFGHAIEASLGHVVRRADLRAAFEASFGKSAGSALSLRCRKDGGRTYLSAVWIRLGPAIGALAPGDGGLNSALLDPDPSFRDRSCPALIFIDRPGLDDMRHERSLGGVAGQGGLG